MRKLYIVIVTAILFIISFFVGKYIYKISRIDSALIAKLKENSEIMQKENQEMYLPTVASDNIKLSPNAILVFKTEYDECGHSLNEYKNILQDEVNMNKKQLQGKYLDWNISEFGEKEVVLQKKVKGSCGQHFVIREKDGNLAVYVLDENDVETLKEETSISTKYLTEIDLLKLKDGIRVNGLEELNSRLEDFE